MSDYEKLKRACRELEEVRNDLSQRIADNDPDKRALVELHDRVSRAIKALSGQG
ncbi:hypothetical protein [Paracoccus homiensis]|uniref:Uncharacterized protein n=1 Tax=Paracoccus homiensis TaxID=364199 RepID=A0A1I0D8D5_9RHOB|nr:hypothetical protein [Paracoccus homiensis]SET27787.1 hypothetical protein SAMN04489858_10425 [Paracoccus homiensis]